MNPIFSGIRSALAGLARPDAPSRTTTPQGYMWQQMGGNRIGPRDSYDNVFPYVNAIAQRFSTIIPYAVDGDGQRITPDPAPITALYSPNDTFSCMEFLKYIATAILTQSHLDILVWTSQGGNAVPGGTITPDNIAGYTFLPQASRVYDSSRSNWYHQVTLTVDGVEDTYNFTRMETIALTYSVHPVDPTRGISPAMTIRKWANVDDMIADYERGFFGNGAVPAGMLGIVSETAADFQRDRNRLEDTFRGAGNNNGVVYNMIPVDPLTRKPSEVGKLVWVPFQQANNTLDLTSVSDLVNGRMANALAVPDIVRGIDNGQTYANAQMAERAFIENTLQPLCMTVWDKWQFELDRLTGGLGYGMNFDLDLPAQTDVESIQATTQQTRVQSLIALVNAGATVPAAVKALGLPEEYNRLTLQPVTPTPAPALASTPAPQLTINNTLPTVEAHQVEAAADIEEADDLEKDPAYEKAYKHVSGFYLNLAKLVRRSQNSYEDDLRKLVEQLTDQLYDDYEATILAYARERGITEAQALAELAEINPTFQPVVGNMSPADMAAVTAWEELPAKYAAAYRKRLDTVVQASAGTVTPEIRAILEKADKEGWTRDRLESELTKYCTGSRARLLARNELGNSLLLGDFYAAEAFSEEMGVTLDYIWECSNDNKTCDLCRYLNGKRVPLGGSFLDKGDSITIDGTTYTNTFMDMTTTHAHPNCRCYPIYDVTGVTPEPGEE